MESFKLSLYTKSLVGRPIHTFLVLKDAKSEVKYHCAMKDGVATVRDGVAAVAELTRLYSTDGSAPTFKIQVAGESPMILITPHTQQGRRCLLALYDTESKVVRYRMTAPWLHSDCDPVPANGDSHAAPLLTVTVASSGERIAHGRQNSSFLASMGLVLSPDDAWSYTVDVASDPTLAPVAVAALCAVILATVVGPEDEEGGGGDKVEEGVQTADGADVAAVAAGEQDAAPLAVAGGDGESGSEDVGVVLLPSLDAAATSPSSLGGHNDNDGVAAAAAAADRVIAPVVTNGSLDLLSAPEASDSHVASAVVEAPSQPPSKAVDDEAAAATALPAAEVASTTPPQPPATAASDGCVIA